jgi:hypothetical protein
MYHLFSFNDYYPNGGLNDYRGSYFTIKEAKAKATVLHLDGKECGWHDYFQIVTEVASELRLVWEGTYRERNERGELIIDWHEKQD